MSEYLSPYDRGSFGGDWKPGDPPPRGYLGTFLVGNNVPIDPLAKGVTVFTQYDRQKIRELTDAGQYQGAPHLRESARRLVEEARREHGLE